mmetsp:Transcript_51780/g.155388  ORF Transcript_51780/g.155388 Transcript_51780/m.155388 type:complete len:97 (+) Transcript_51780:393-683(+)
MSTFPTYSANCSLVMLLFHILTLHDLLQRNAAANFWVESDPSDCDSDWNRISARKRSRKHDATDLSLGVAAAFAITSRAEAATRETGCTRLSKEKV